MISAKELKILEALNENSRNSIPQIAKKAKISKDSARYMIKKLEQDQIITGFYTLVDAYKLGFSMVKLFIKFSKFPNKEEVLNSLKKKKEIVWAGFCEGSWDLIITLHAKEMPNLLGAIKDLNLKNVERKQIILGQKVELASELSVLTNSSNFQTLDINSEPLKIDEKDSILLKNLVKNSRASCVDISEKVSLTPEAIAKRLRNLKKKEIILGHRTRLNFKKLGFSYNHIYFSLKDKSKLLELETFCKNLSGCISIIHFEGVYDLQIEFLTKSSGEIRDHLEKIRHEFDILITDYFSTNILDETSSVLSYF